MCIRDSLLGRVLPIGRGWRLLIICLSLVAFLAWTVMFAGSQIADQAATLQDVYKRRAEIVAAVGGDGITAHLREDRRHIRDDDLARIQAATDLPLNLEMAATDEMLAIALRHAPHLSLIHISILQHDNLRARNPLI